MKAPHWILGYESPEGLFGRRSKRSIEVDGVTFHVISQEEINEELLKRLSRVAREGELELMSDLERIPYIAARLNSAMSLGSLLRRIEFTICELLGAEAASILVHRGDHLEFMITAGGASGRIEMIPVPMNSIAGTVFTEERTMIFNDLERESRHFKGVDKASGFVTRNILASPIWVGSEKYGVIEVLNKEEGFDEKDARILETFAKLIGRKLHSTVESERFKSLLRDIFIAIVTALDKRDRYTHSHSRNVANYSVGIGRVLGLPERDLEELEISAILHDIGKIGIPDSILLKPGRLTPEEFKAIKMHTVIGGEILSKIKYAGERIALGALEHHERLDGSGYPHGKKNGEVSLFGRIIGVADVFDALSAKRVYKEGMDVREVIEILENDAKNGKFDTRVLEALKRHLGLEG